MMEVNCLVNCFVILGFVEAISFLYNEINFNTVLFTEGHFDSLNSIVVSHAKVFNEFSRQMIARTE